MNKEQIKVLIVDDSPTSCKILTELLNTDSELMVVGVARNGKEAIDLVPKLKPDIICMDIYMPVMDGYEATKQIMANNPTPILIVSSAVFEKGTDKVFAAISLGALDVIQKNPLQDGDEQKTSEFLNKIKFLSNIKVIRHPLAKLERPKTPKISKASVNGKVVGIAASTGGPEALHKVLKGLSKDFPYGILVVQHISSGFVEGLVDWLNKDSALTIKVAQDKEKIKPGTVYLAPNDKQMRASDDGSIRITDEPPFEGFRPSASVMFKSIGLSFKDKAVGVVMTGMGEDGVKGIKTIRENGGLTVAQDEKSSVVFGMPKAAIDRGVIDDVLPLDHIAEFLIKEL